MYLDFRWSVILMICSTKMQRSLNYLSCRNCNRISLLPIPKPTKPLLSLFSSLIKSENPHSSFVVTYLTETFNFSKERAQSLSFRYNYIKSPEKPQSVVDYFQTLGFSQTHIRSSVRSAPEILFLNVDKTLKPKIELFQQLGLVGSHLGKFISKNSTLLTLSLEKKLIPNIEYLESCGIVGSQLSMLLKSKPRVFAMEECKLRELVSRTLDKGFSVLSRMFVHGLGAVSSMSEEVFERKLQLLRSFGFSQDELMDMFRRSPTCLMLSEEKLKLGLDFFLYKMLIRKEVLFRRPMCLTYSIEDRVIPRYEVVQILKSKGLLKKEPSVSHLLGLTEKDFLEKFVARFRDAAEELSVAYNGHMLDSSPSSSTPSSEADWEEKES